MSSNETLDVAAKAFGFAVVIFGALFAILRFGFGVGVAKRSVDGDKRELETAIANGFALVKQEFTASIGEVKSSVASIGVTLGSRIDGVSSRMDRVDRHREDDLKSRAVADAVEQQRRIDEAARRATAEERERTMQVVVAEIREDLDQIMKAQSSDRSAMREQMHDQAARISALEREVRSAESAE